jgi:predicted KAP-like P-loop ATPase
VLIPDHETAVDFLNYEAVAKTVVALLKDNRDRPLTIGIHGDWGAGKSSVLKMVESVMAKDNNVACLWFNGWTFQGFDDAKTVLIEVIITELIRQRSAVGKVKEAGGALLKRLDWMKIARRGAGLAFNLATGLPSPDQVATALRSLKELAGTLKGMAPEEVEGKLNEAAGFLKPAEEHRIPEQIHHFRDEFAKLLKEARIDQLVVLIDDLDRCLPATAIDTLEAIRLFLFVPQTAFVIGADEGMIEYAVREHFPNLPVSTGTIPYPRTYLEKLIQVPFRIPALGMQESHAYVTLLLVQALVGEDHAGFKELLAKARKSLNQPWVGVGISQGDVRAVDPPRQTALDDAFVLAEQIAPILAEGTKGNPRQVKRFLNSLGIRLAIATERGFGDTMNRSVLAKLMLAERFQPDFYDYLAAETMRARDGKVDELRNMEAAAQATAKGGKGKNTKGEKAGEPLSAEAEKWLAREWLTRWLKIEPVLGDIDLRPYVFVARDKRILAGASEPTGIEGLVETLSGSEMAARSVEPQVKALVAADAEVAFASLRERTLRQGSLVAQPPGFDGLMLVAKHHPRHQAELLTLLDGMDAKALGVWVVKGWNEVLTDPGTQQQLRILLTKWASQDENGALTRAAGQALATPQKGQR